MNERWAMKQLVAVVEKALARAPYDGQRSARVRGVPDQRTIRYYTTLGLLDPPAEMRGRTALYGRRHVFQLVAIKRLQSHGLSLSQVQQAMLGVDNRRLSRWAALPTGFWEQASTVLPAASLSPEALLAPTMPLDSVPPRRQDGLRRTFWMSTPSVANVADKSRPDLSASPIPQPAIHLPVAEGVKLMLEGVDQNRLDQDTIARLTPALEQLAEVLQSLDLSKPAQRGTSEQDSTRTRRKNQGK